MFFFQIIAPQFKHFQKLRDFVEMKLPPGFPVKVDIPVLPTVSARVTFHDFAWKNVQNDKKDDEDDQEDQEDDILPAELFDIPKDYVEDNTRFPDL